MQGALRGPFISSILSASSETIRYREAENGPYHIVESDDILRRDGSRQGPFHDARTDDKTGKESEFVSSVTSTK